MTRNRLITAGIVLLLMAIAVQGALTDRFSCERAEPTRHSLIALHAGFVASAEGRYTKAARQPDPKLAAEERKEGDGLYRLAREISVKPIHCSGIFPSAR